jgi:phosphate butyryltransferase
MIKSFEDLLNQVKKKDSAIIALAAAQDRSVLEAANDAYLQGIARSILIGNKSEILAIADEICMDVDKFEIIHTEDKAEAGLIAAGLVRDGRATLPMKGFMDTSLILKAILNKKSGLNAGGLLSHVGVLKSPHFDRLFIVSDSAMSISPTLEDKVKIINNAVKVAHSLGNANPKVAVLCAVEKVNEKMPATVDAARLTEMNERGEITGCIIKGPLGLDNAVSLQSARHKGIEHTVAGNADILIVPDIESGNMLNKSMEYFGKAEKAGVIMGAKAPVILTSRASSAEAKLNSIALSVLIARQQNG